MALSKMAEEFLGFLLNNKQLQGITFLKMQELPENLKKHIFGLADELEEERLIENLVKYGSYDNHQVHFAFMPKAFSYFEEKEISKMAYFNETNYINNFGDNSTGTQIQQNVAKSSQKMDLHQEINYEKAEEIIDNIKKYINELGVGEDQQARISKIVSEIEPFIKEKKESQFIKGSLCIIRDFLIEVSGSIAASGILHLISQIH